MDTKPIILDEQLCFSIYQAHKMFNKFYAVALKAYDLTYIQYIVMLTLYQHHKMSVKALGDHVALDSGTLTPLLRRLEQKGWIVRQRSSEDERRLEVMPTSYALKMRDDIYKHVGSCIDQLKFSDQEYEAMMADMLDLKDNLADVARKI